jgi:putative zinc finger/helix-turn-helix YgiT family protein
MKCTECDATMKTGKESYKYDECGLDNVTLVGVTVSRCPECGTFEVAIPAMESLHRVIAWQVAGRPGRLTPPEFRFLRKYLGHSSKDLAAQLDVKPETVSRWENGKAEIGWSYELALRQSALMQHPVSTYPIPFKKPPPKKPGGGVKFRNTASAWRQVSAAG